MSRKFMVWTRQSLVVVTILMGLGALVLLGGGIFKWQSVLNLPIVGTHPFLWALVFALGSLLMGFIRQRHPIKQSKGERLPEATAPVKPQMPETKPAVLPPETTMAGVATAEATIGTAILIDEDLLKLGSLVGDMGALPEGGYDDDLSLDLAESEAGDDLMLDTLEDVESCTAPSGSASSGQSTINSPTLQSPPNLQFGSHPSPLKLSTGSQPLPHDGLFIRRNSSFGTQLTTGMKELIAQGVMIEKTQIRFDEFVAPNTDGIPSPQPHHALAVSYGIATIPTSQRHNGRATHYLEIALKTTHLAPGGHLETQTPPVNYIFVVDVSGSMAGEKINTVKASIRELFTRLRADDVIGVIAFDHQVKTLLESTPKQNLSADEFGRVINSLNVAGGTDINLGLAVSIDEMRRYRGVQRVNQLFLFSDGNPYNGETNWIKIRQNVATKLRQTAATDGNIRLSTLVFGTDANKVELDKLAGITGGQSIFIIEPQDVIYALQQELARRTHLAAINVQMQIEISPDIQILHFYGHDLITDPTTRAAVERQAEVTGKSVETNYGVKSQPDLIKEDKGIRVFVPNLAVGETYWVVFELAVPEALESSTFGKATVQYFDTFARANQKPQFDLSPPGTIDPPWVIQHALGLWTSEVAFYALSDVEAREINTAERRIQAHIAVLESARTDLSVQAPVKLIDDIITLNKFLSLAQNLNQTNSLTYLGYGLKELEGARNGFLQMKEGQLGEFR